MAWLGRASPGKARLGQAGLGGARHGKAKQGFKTKKRRTVLAEPSSAIHTNEKIIP